MKAVLCKAFGPAESLVLEDVASPVAKKNEILLDVHAAGVNFPDTLIIEGKYQFKPPFPFSPGGEAAGVVTAVGEKVSHLKVGDRVALVLDATRLPLGSLRIDALELQARSLALQLPRPQLRRERPRRPRCRRPRPRRRPR